MKIHINGEPLTLNHSANLTEALQQYLSKTQQNMSYAIALNSDFINKSLYTSTLLQDGDSIDVLFPIHGG